ncbi:MAG: flagellar motor protein MotA [Alphaproteobacteria bacterium RIFOXYD12_FULL_60_8]|nr:MAG: flagellar motor protein MotA [Alphaproteobacteria bacterium RIFOXYD12_FULL_60_8]
MAEGMDDGGSPEKRLVFDPATVVGVLGALALVAAAIFMGGAPSAFIDIPSVLIVVLGTVFVTTISFTVKEMLGSVMVVSKTVAYPTQDPSETAIQMMQLADVARKKGVLGLQGSLLDSLRPQPLLFKGMALVVDGVPGDEVENIIGREIGAILTRHARATDILRRAAEISPAMGLIGTLIGLVQMLGSLDDPSSIGPSMAVALLTTFYGAIMANVLFLPLASKLERNSTDETLIYHLQMLGISSIGRQENPRRLEMLLNSILPPVARIRYFD